MFKLPFAGFNPLTSFKNSAQPYWSDPVVH